MIKHVIKINKNAKRESDYIAFSFLLGYWWGFKGTLSTKPEQKAFEHVNYCLAVRKD